MEDPYYNEYINWESSTMGMQEEGAKRKKNLRRNMWSGKRQQQGIAEDVTPKYQAILIDGEKVVVLTNFFIPI